MTIASHIQKLELGALIELFEIDTTTIGGSEKFYFYPGNPEGLAPLLWQGITYQPFPIKAEGFEMSARGTLPRPTLTVSDVTGVLSVLVRDYDDLLGARVVRRRTYDMYLDGRPGADPDQHLPDDIFFVERKPRAISGIDVQFELASAMDLEGVQLPSRTIIAGYCSWEYRSAECSYTGTDYFDVNDQPVASLALDVCGKRVSSCKCRFGARNTLPFGGFPAARIYRN